MRGIVKLQRRCFSAHGNVVLQSTNVQAKILKRAWNNTEQLRVSSFKLWLSHLRGVTYTRDRLRVYQKKLMEGVNLPQSVRCVNATTSRGINQWHFHNPSLVGSEAAVKPPVLLIHGYASSSMSYFRNFRGLSSQCKDVYAIDLPANGLSREISLSEDADLKDLVKYSLQVKGLDSPGQVKVTKPYNNKLCATQLRILEDYYVDEIERWRVENQIDQLHLVGHSFGGYISYKYALKYPQNVMKLALISPLGVERNLYSVNNHLPQDSIVQGTFEDPSSPSYLRKLEVPRYIFENQLKILRWGGPMGARLCWNYITSAYAKVPSREFKEYLFELFYGDGGITKTALTTFILLFTRNLLARDPIMDSIAELKVKDVMFQYGQYDWMNKNAGARAAELLRKQPYNNSALYLEIPESGHNLFLDSPQSFNFSLISFLAD
ncbi:uncharacterized protein KNAG_0H03120 [Huiozyma naganishii CBS 8797]|uniref:AB hydrolase-1 domain-containing protein n=1 Tax=Huiozyma naganishii (strain ATCC MYA-139 / BCRC 22969 / CBS 8797 / KCTC 17520 / NBRC 10181 / NCYC 3082 / Yp74L-3) TaxID=1071383 RepID=J7S1Y5_HUIN7|nr:hypothetical protein KNAG_0H03120 [Kazachstania naganishii CBS 8797]CCK71727.1 hypothetical protein KNAG_0H03120 [Kazachstania naganishii CBS 8797]